MLLNKVSRWRGTVKTKRSPSVDTVNCRCRKVSYSNSLWWPLRSESIKWRCDLACDLVSIFTFLTICKVLTTSLSLLCPLRTDDTFYLTVHSTCLKSCIRHLAHDSNKGKWVWELTVLCTSFFLHTTCGSLAWKSLVIITQNNCVKVCNHMIFQPVCQNNIEWCI